MIESRASRKRNSFDWEGVNGLREPEVMVSVRVYERDSDASNLEKLQATGCGLQAVSGAQATRRLQSAVCSLQPCFRQSPYGDIPIATMLQASTGSMPSARARATSASLSLPGF